MSIVVIAVVAIFVYVLVKYGRKNSKGYDPDIEGSVKLEILWIVIPVILCVLLAVPTVKTIFDEEKAPGPSQNTAEAVEPLTIEVTSVDWKWLFRYPEQGIETVNYAVIPEDVPINFELKAIGAINSFWVPQLGGQRYTMPGMKMNLWLQADHPGDYLGRSANFSGKGFTGMDFHILSKKQSGFNDWVKDVKKTEPPLTNKKYQKLLAPGNAGRMTFSSYPKKLDEQDSMSMDMKGGMEHDSKH